MKELLFKKLSKNTGIAIALAEKGDRLWYLDSPGGLRHFMPLGVFWVQYPDTTYRTINFVFWSLTIVLAKKGR